MRRILLFASIIVATINTTISQTHPQISVTISTQEQVDTFSYTNVRGTLTIREASPGTIQNLDNLSILTSVGALQIFNNSAITNLDGLSNITNSYDPDTNDNSIVWINITDNSALKNIDGLSGIVALNSNGVLTIRDNVALENLDGLSNVKYINLDEYRYFGMEIEGNSSLNNACGIKNILEYPEINLRADIVDNGPNTSSVEDILNNCDTCEIFDGDLTLRSQTEINEFNYCEITGTLTVTETLAGDVKDLSNLDSLEKLGGGLIIKGNRSLQAVNAFSKLTAINGALEIINNFSLTDLQGFSNITSIQNSLKIVNNNLTSLSGFSNLTAVHSLTLNNSKVSNLNGLSRLESINALYLYSNANLNSISGLGLFNAESYQLNLLHILNNDTLESITGLDALASVKIEVKIKNNEILKTLDPLSNLSITKKLDVSDNPSLESACGIAQLLEDQTAVGTISIRNNGPNTSTIEDIIENCIFQGNIVLETQADVDNFTYRNIMGNLTVQESSAAAIRNLEGLSSLESVSGDILIKNNVALYNLNGLTSISTIKGDLSIDTNYNITSLGDFENLVQIGGTLNIINNQQLKKIDRFSSLKKIWGTINLSNNKKLINIDGLSKTSVVFDRVIIEDNPKLKNLDGLSGIWGIYSSLTIKGNTGLENACGVLHLLEGSRFDYRAPSLGASGYIIENNGPIYSSKTAIIESCNKTFDGDITLTSQAEVDNFDYNIVKGRLTIKESVSGNITNLDGLQNLKRVGSLHIINNTMLERLGLLNLMKITDPSGDILVLDTNGESGDFGNYIIDHFFCYRTITGSKSKTIKTRSSLSNPFISLRTDKYDVTCIPIQPRNSFGDERETGDDKTSNLAEESNRERIIVFPTLSNGTMINLAGAKTDFSYAVYNATGTLIQQKTMQNSSQTATIKFNTPLQSGMYFMKIQEQDRATTLRFMVK